MFKKGLVLLLVLMTVFTGCAAAEEICKGGFGSGIKSESTDGYSVTYSDSFSQKSEISRIFDAIRIYLEPTGLLYRGMNGGGADA